MHHDGITTITLFRVRSDHNGAPLKIKAIKFLRAMAAMQYRSLGLKEGKALVDTMIATGHRVEINVPDNHAAIVRTAAQDGFVLYEDEVHSISFATYCDSNSPIPF